MPTIIVRFFLSVWLLIPVGRICRVHHSKDSHMTLSKDFWVVVKNGKASARFPLSAVAPYMQNEFALRMKAVGYNVDKFFDFKEQETVHVAPAQEFDGRIEPDFEQNSLENSGTTTVSKT